MNDSDNEIQFPQFRKYKNGKSYFKIVSAVEFEEIRYQPGNRWELSHHKATILPDRNFILDLTKHYEANWDKIEEAEYMAVKSKLNS